MKIKKLSLQERWILEEVRKHSRGHGISQRELKESCPFLLHERDIRLIITKLINVYLFPICSDPSPDTGGYWWPENHEEIKEVPKRWAIKANKLKHRERSLLKGWYIYERSRKENQAEQLELVITNNKRNLHEEKNHILFRR